MAAGAQLEQPLIQPASLPEDSKGAWLPSPPTIVGFAFLTLSSAMAVSSWRRGLGAVFFVAFSYLDLVVLFYCLRVYRRAPPGSLRRENLRVAMWLLATMLTISFLQLLEFWFLCVGNSRGFIVDFMDDTACPRQNPYPSTVP
ncbi:hypothetical protein HU200_006352 [Digitaria exilis]|uniref:Uncharacterized protein n=1 Tax=Digitaria exilis TaxID=1010633 RepID=A0A835KS90_9POAL|nr:hypothetical protein HU200_006352 [Digitaria exilis]CAB3446110.1 unnamed protein product [Digitaria exilis]